MLLQCVTPIERQYPNGAQRRRGVIAVATMRERKYSGKQKALYRSWSFLCVGVGRCYSENRQDTEEFPRSQMLHIEVYSDKLSTQYIGEMMQHIRIGDAVDGSICGDGEEEDVGEERVSRLDAGDHASSAEGLDQEDERHY